MGNCAGSPKTKADHDAVPTPEPAKEESLAMTTNEEAKLQPQEKKEVNVGHQDEKQIIDAAHNVNSLHENNAPSLGSFLVEVYILYLFHIIWVGVRKRDDQEEERENIYKAFKVQLSIDIYCLQFGHSPIVRLTYLTSLWAARDLPR